MIEVMKRIISTIVHILNDNEELVEDLLIYLIGLHIIA
jgi:hypothetical protein